jgi:hypothetical protein
MKAPTSPFSFAIAWPARTAAAISVAVRRVQLAMTTSSTRTAA